MEILLVAQNDDVLWGVLVKSRFGASVAQTGLFNRVFESDSASDCSSDVYECIEARPKLFGPQMVSPGMPKDVAEFVVKIA